MDFALTDDQAAIRDAIERICARFGDDYWLEKDRGGGFLARFHAGLVIGVDIGAPDIHARAPPDRFKTFKDFDVRGAIIRRRLRSGTDGRFGRLRFLRRFRVGSGASEEIWRHALSVRFVPESGKSNF